MFHRHQKQCVHFRLGYFIINFQFAKEKSFFFSFSLSRSGEITDHGTNIVSHSLLVVFACRFVNTRRQAKQVDWSFWKDLYGFIRVITNLFFKANVFTCFQRQFTIIGSHSRDHTLSISAFHSPINRILFVFVWILLFLFFQQKIHVTQIPDNCWPYRRWIKF